MSKYENQIIQIALNQVDFNRLSVDGIIGPKTNEALVKFKLSMGLSPTSRLSRVVKRVLFESACKKKPPFWLLVGELNSGIREIKGKTHNSKIISFFKNIGSWVRDDETPWCAAFVGSVLEDCLIPSTSKPSARSYTKWGQKLDGPATGAVVVFWRGRRLGWSGHVGFVEGKDEKGHLMVLGGNQSNAVNVKPFNTNRVLGYHWPVNCNKPKVGFETLPVVISEHGLSKNEV